MTDKLRKAAEQAIEAIDSTVILLGKKYLGVTQKTLKIRANKLREAILLQDTHHVVPLHEYEEVKLQLFHWKSYAVQLQKKLAKYEENSPMVMNVNLTLPTKQEK